ncbi:MAG: hypothetical protein FWD25_05115 [Clostridia bacterium]|nr:hypothetical protein [Clostridia bacterium]
MNMTVRARQWSILGTGSILAIGAVATLLFWDGQTPSAAMALLLSLPTALWWGIGATHLLPTRPIWDAGSSRWLALADRWLFGGLCAAAVAGPGLASLIALYSRMLTFPGVLPALAVICVALAQFVGYQAFCSGRLYLLRRWPGRFC